MESDTRVKLNAYQLAALGLLSGTIVSIATYLVMRLLLSPIGEHQPAESGESGSEPPIQPGIDPEMPAHVPHHFTEDLVIPGFTETGQDVERDDDTKGRSPEGV